MPRPAKPPRLWLQPEQKRKDGRIEPSVWCIIDRGRKHRTGFPPEQLEEATQALTAYLTERREIPRERNRHPSQILIADVLNLYATDKVPKHARPDETAMRIDALSRYFGEKTLSEINGKTCRAYVTYRGKEQAARRELEDLRAAINYHRNQGYCSEIVAIELPERSPSRERWLTRDEAARLIWAAWTYREVQKGKPTGRRSRKHVAKFILVSLYTGTRSSAVCSAALSQMDARSWIDLDHGVFYRRPSGQRETKKRQPPCRISLKLLAHLRRWKGNGQAFAVEFNGEPVCSVRKAFAQAIKDAGLDGRVTPHVLRHTAATWMMQNGANPWDAADYLGMTEETLRRVYGHHHPEHQERAREVFDRPHRVKRPKSEAVKLRATG